MAYRVSLASPWSERRLPLTRSAAHFRTETINGGEILTRHRRGHRHLVGRYLSGTFHRSAQGTRIPSLGSRNETGSPVAA